MSSRSNVDLNLLIYFEALFLEQHVSRAAERVNLSQPAMSLALKRLREMFNDQLFVQTSGGMAPTPRAQELIDPVRELLKRSRGLIEMGNPFDPATAEETLQIVAADYVASLVLQRLVPRLLAQAPGIRLIVRPPNVAQLKRWFEEGQVGLGIGYTEDPPAELHSRPILRDRVVAIARIGHPLVDGALTLEQLLALPYIEVLPMRKPRYAIALEQTLAAQGHKLRPSLTVADPGAALDVVEATDMVVIVPELLARRYLMRGKLQALLMPVALPESTLSMVWHPRSHQDQSYIWLRKQVSEACASF